jgi:hypothetical protein
MPDSIVTLVVGCTTTCIICLIGAVRLLLLIAGTSTTERDRTWLEQSHHTVQNLEVQELQQN